MASVRLGDSGQLGDSGRLGERGAADGRYPAGPDGAGPEAGDRDVAGRYTVRSVARAMRLVHIVADGQPEGLTLSDLARALGTSKSTTLALARTLTAFGMLRDGRPGPRYTLGTGLIRLGDIARGQLPLGDLSRPLLTELSELTKMTSRLAICDDGFPVFIERVDGPGSVRFHTPLGQREMPHSSAAGKAILATIASGPGTRPVRADRPSAADRPYHHRPRLPAGEPGSRAQQWLRHRRRGGRGGIFCLGAAFFGHDGAVAGAVSVTGIKGDLPAWRVNELGQAVRRAADRVSEILGGPRYAERDPSGSATA